MLKLYIMTSFAARQRLERIQAILRAMARLQYLSPAEVADLKEDALQASLQLDDVIRFVKNAKDQIV